jgi:hypothetical protein
MSERLGFEGREVGLKRRLRGWAAGCRQHRNHEKKDTLH